MKKQKSAKHRDTTADATTELSKLMERKPCYTPFSVQAIVDSAAPKRPSMEPPTLKLVAQLRRDAQELLNRAFAGAADAARELCSFAHNLTRQLTNLSKKQRNQISAIASGYEDWPILYAPDDTTSLKLYSELGVGTDSFVQRYAGRKINRCDNPWTDTALLFLGLLRWCKQRLPEIIRENQPCRKMSPCFAQVGRTQIRIYYYDTPNGIFEVPEWCELCLSLPDKLRPDNVEQFWNVARLAILGHWAASEVFGSKPSAYKEALNCKTFRKGHNYESLRRADVLDAIKAAMVSLAVERK